MNTLTLKLKQASSAARGIVALTAMAFGLQAGLAHAQPQDRPDRDRDQRHEQPHRDARPPAREATPQRAPDHRQLAARPGPQAERGRGAGPDHRFHRGDRLPGDYRGKQYVVDDWRGHHLSAPPRGHRWVQVGADYALIAVATGLIAQIVLAH
ncbi:RcnB family protein [Pseudorhodoferax sp.]|uniref:RcnB family protein n=1 Tax=Pseudorhodoferax sp. TaxID=1993553 RepID=UPI002DD65D43|nr:RcnB family protein [Pseudorhodoferax sp.]